MYRYQGNTGRYIWVPDDPVREAAPGSGRQRPSQPPPPEEPGRRRDARRRGTDEPESPFSALRDLGGNLGGILSGVFPDGFEMEDALLLLVLFLMYKETGDKNLLIIMGAMFLL